MFYFWYDKIKTYKLAWLSVVCSAAILCVVTQRSSLCREECCVMTQRIAVKQTRQSAEDVFFFFLSLVSLLSFCCLCRLHNSEHGDIRSILSNGQVFSGLLVNGRFSKRYMHLYFLSCSYNFALATLYFDGFLKVSNACSVVTIAPLLCHIHFLFSLLVIPSIINCHWRAWSIKRTRNQSQRL